MRARKSQQCFCLGIEFWFARAEAPPKRLILFLIAAFCRLAKSLSHSQQMGWLVGAVGIESNTRWNFKDLEEMLGSAKTLKRNNEESSGILNGPSMAPRFFERVKFLCRGFFTHYPR